MGCSIMAAGVLLGEKLRTKTARLEQWVKVPMQGCVVAFPCCLVPVQAALDMCFCPLCSVSPAERRSGNSRVCNQQISLIAEWLCAAELSHTLSPRVARRKHNL